MPELGEMIEGKNKQVKKLIDFDGSSCYFAVAEIDGSSWKLGVSVPAANVTDSLAAMVMVAFVITLVIILFAAVFMAGLIGRVLAPIQMLKQFASGDFFENIISDKTIPKEYKNEAEQIKKATLEVRKQIREIILNTKKQKISIPLPRGILLKWRT